MPLDLKELFDAEMQLIQEETPLMPLAEQVKLAEDRLIERLTGYVTRIGGQRKAAHADAVNRAHFD